MGVADHGQRAVLGIDAGVGVNLWVSHLNALPIAVKGAGSGLIKPTIVEEATSSE
jgi:hypothetical protein